MHRMKYFTGLFFKGMGMGAANVIPGVSGGTIALITGIFEELINSIKSFDMQAIRLFFTGRFKQFARHINLTFLVWVFLGVIVSIFSIAKLLEFLFLQYPVYIWAYFFGLILASVYFVGKTIERFNPMVIIMLIAGTAIAAGLSVLNPATENDGFIYLIVSGVVAVCSMILPGLSGSFVLILMGNYELVVIDGVGGARMDILFPVFIGIVVGLIAFSHFLSYLYKNFRDQTVAVLTGFILGSLSVLWPWKEPRYQHDVHGNILFKPDGEPIIQKWERFVPREINREVILVLLVITGGIITIWLIEKFAAIKTK